MLVISLCYN